MLTYVIASLSLYIQGIAAQCQQRLSIAFLLISGCFHYLPGTYARQEGKLMFIDGDHTIVRFSIYVK